MNHIKTYVKFTVQLFENQNNDILLDIKDIFLDIEDSNKVVVHYKDVLCSDTTKDRIIQVRICSTDYPSFDRELTIFNLNDEIIDCIDRLIDYLKIKSIREPFFDVDFYNDSGDYSESTYKEIKDLIYGRRNSDIYNLYIDIDLDRTLQRWTFDTL